jgi:ribosomal protein L24E
MGVAESRYSGKTPSPGRGAAYTRKCGMVIHTVVTSRPNCLVPHTQTEREGEVWR